MTAPNRGLSYSNQQHTAGLPEKHGVVKAIES